MQETCVYKKRRFLFPESNTGRCIVDVQLMVTKAQCKFQNSVYLYELGTFDFSYFKSSCNIASRLRLRSSLAKDVILIFIGFCKYFLLSDNYAIVIN